MALHYRLDWHGLYNRIDRTKCPRPFGLVTMFGGDHATVLKGVTIGDNSVAQRA